MTNETPETTKLQVEKVFIELYTGTLARYFPILKIDEKVMYFQQRFGKSTVIATHFKLLKIAAISETDLIDAIKQAIWKISGYLSNCLSGGFRHTDPYTGIEIDVSSNIPKKNFTLKEFKYEVQPGFEGALYANFDKTDLIKTSTGQYLLTMQVFPSIITPEKVKVYNSTLEPVVEA